MTYCQALERKYGRVALAASSRPTRFLAKVEAGNLLAKLKSFMSKVSKKTLQLLVGIGLFSGIAQGMSFNETQIKKYNAEMTKAVEHDGAALKAHADFIRIGRDAYKVVFHFRAEDGSGADVVVIHAADLINSVELKEFKASDGSGTNYDVEYLAKHLYERVNEEIQKENLK